MTDRDSAASRLGVESEELWDADYHVVAAEGTADFLREISLGTTAAELRLLSPTNDRLQLWREGQASQLQTMRRLTGESAALLASVCEKAGADDEVEAEDLLQGAGFGTRDSNKAVEKAAVAAVTQLYREREWDVQSVERVKIGYDLLCPNGSSEEHVEAVCHRNRKRSEPS